MRLTSRLARDFSGRVRNRGENYFRQGRVRIQNGSSSEVAARVQGSRSYQVSLDWEDGTLSALCDCTYFDSEGPCKHLWATVLKAELHGYLGAAVTAASFEADYIGYDPPLRASPPAPVAKPPAPKPPAWRKQLAGISNQRDPSAWSGDALPEKRQILYIVNVPGSVSAGALVLALGSRDRKADGSWTLRGAPTLRRAQVAELPLAADRAILSALLGVKQHYGWDYSDSYESVPTSCLVKHPLAGMVMGMAARSGRCFLQLVRESDDLLPLEWDEGEPWRFGLEMRRHEGGWAVAGVLRRAEERMEAGAPALITPGGLATWYRHTR